MAKARAIIKRRKVVVNIRKICRTMEMIATARFKRAFDRAVAARAYTQKIAEMAADIAASAVEVRHPLLEVHEPLRAAWLLVLTSNRGLCGGFNSGVLRVAMDKRRELVGHGVAVRDYVIGKRGITYYRYQRIAPAQTDMRFEDRPAFQDVETLAVRFMRDYIEHRTDALYVAYMKFLSSARQEPVVETLLPVGRLEGPPTARVRVDYEFLPDAESLVSALVPVTFKTRLFKCFLDSAVSEQVARRVAMHGAVENADKMTTTLTQMYNRARQTQITNEISELMGGAEALKG